MTDIEILSSLRSYVTENYLYMRSGFELRDDDSLFETGIIDSMGVMELILVLEREFGLTVRDDEITEENLGSLAAIASFVVRKRAGNEAVGRRTA